MAKKKPAADPDTDQAKAEAKKAPARSKFAEFRNKLKKNDLDPEPATAPPPTILAAEPLLPLSSLDCEILLEQANKPKEASLPDTNAPVACSSDGDKVVPPSDNGGTPAPTKAKGKVRSRPSDLIIFDSPVAQKPTSRAFRGQDIAESICETSCVPCISINPASPPTADADHEAEENKENTSLGGDDSFFSFAIKPITWRQNQQPAAATTPKLSNLLSSHRAGVQQNKSPLTPRLTNTAPDVGRDSVGGPLINSPLLKLAYISSHGKRSSLSSKNL